MFRSGKLLLAAAMSMVLASCATPQTASAPQLVGTWHQEEAACGTAQPVRELIFSADGRFSVTWLPFETYKDYWGAWRYDAATRVLTLSVENGNRVPSDIAPSGAVSIDAHQLALGAVS